MKGDAYHRKNDYFGCSSNSYTKPDFFMNAKGTLVSSINRFVEENFPDRYKDWLGRLPELSKKVYAGTVLATEWYPLDAAVVVPTKLIGEMFYAGNIQKAAWESGRHSAKVALTGIYKVFVLIATPQYIMKRGGKIMTSFYDPSSLVIGGHRPKGVDVHITEFPAANEVVEHRIGGWMQQALEICGCKHVVIEMPQSLTKGDKITEYIINWD
jgi:hypothetical protein